MEIDLQSEIDEMNGQIAALYEMGRDKEAMEPAHKVRDLALSILGDAHPNCTDDACFGSHFTGSNCLRAHRTLSSSGLPARQQTSD